LPAERLHDSLVTVSDVRYVVVSIQVSPAIGVPEPDALAAHQMKGFVVEERRMRSQDLPSPLEQIVVRDGSRFFHASHQRAMLST
jgi:hypothetical protein